jgi:lipopolysaccharide/colanic/teichoic acid biosynthesis glycosyltransferase
MHTSQVALVLHYTTIHSSSLSGGVKMSTLVAEKKPGTMYRTSGLTIATTTKKTFGRPNQPFFNEPEFRGFLIRERKRSDRTKSPLLLALIDVSVIARADMSNHLMQGKIREGLEKCSREVDLRGWYKESQEIGILYSDIRLDAVDGIITKLKNFIKAVFGETMCQAITVRHVVYPLDVAQHPLTSEIERSILYPEEDLATPSTRFQRVLKRFSDIALASSALVVFMPVFAVIAALIKLSSPGPVIYRQERLGYGGKRFKLYKFRSMKPNCETGSHKDFVLALIKGGPTGPTADTGIYKIVNDPRITRIGQILRKTSLDELPQLFNVLKGEMSLVGPRPPIPYEVEAYAPWHRRRLLEAIPGITGLWQIEGRSHTSFDDMVRMDIRYSTSWSLWLDIKLLFKTPVSVLVGKGAC